MSLQQFSPSEADSSVLVKRCVNSSAWPCVWMQMDLRRPPRRRLLQLPPRQSFPCRRGCPCLLGRPWAHHLRPPGCRHAIASWCRDQALTQQHQNDVHVSPSNLLVVLWQCCPNENLLVNLSGHHSLHTGRASLPTE